MAAHKNTPILILAVLPILLLTTPLFSATELGIRAGYSWWTLAFDYPEYFKFNYPGPIVAFCDFFSDRLFGARVEAGWDQILERDAPIREGSINAEGRLVLSEDTYSSKSRLHLVTISLLSKITSPTSPFRYYGTAGLKFDLPVASRYYDSYSTSTWKIGDDTEYKRYAAFLGLQAGGGVDYLFGNWRFGLSTDILFRLIPFYAKGKDATAADGTTNVASVSPGSEKSIIADGLPGEYPGEQFLKKPFITVSLNVAYRGLFSRRKQ